MDHLVDRSIKDGFEIFDLGIGDASYKTAWETHNLKLYSHERAMTAAGQVYLQMRRIRRFIKPGGVRTWFRRRIEEPDGQENRNLHAILIVYMRRGSP